MAITWGSSISSSSGNGVRLGYELSQSPSSVGTGTSSVTVTLKLYVATRYPVSDSSNSWAISGNFSGSGSVNISHGSGGSWSSGNVTLIATRTRTVSPSYASTISSSFSASISGVEAVSGTARASGSITTGRRPISAPATPTNAKVALNGDTSQTVTWSNTSPTSASNPYQKVQIQRWTITGDAWVTIATLDGAPSSYTDRSTAANNQYRYRVRAYNTAGYSGYDYTPYISTTPAAPGTPKATKNSGGDIVVTWSLSPVKKNTGIEVWLTEGGADKPSRHVLLGANATSWTHNSPLASSTWSYRVKAVVGPTGSTETGPTLSSVFSGRSNTVQLLTNPLAPTNLAPASVVRDGTLPINLTWRHNEVDGTDQTAFQIAHRVQGTTTWTYTGKLTSTASAFILGGGTYTNGETIEWRVQTWGLYADPGPLSTSALITLSTPPSATIQLPEDGAVIDGTRTGASWDFFDPEGNAQSQWRATLVDASGTTVETRSGTGTAGSLPAFNAILGDGETYRVRVEVRDSTGLWSEPDEVTVLAQYPLPPRPTLAVIWDHEAGAVIIDITNPGMLDGEVESIHNEVWRSINGDPWEQIADQVPLDTAITDYLPALGAFNHYRVVAISALPSRRESEAALADTTDHRGWVWVNAGPGFMQSIRIRDNAKLGVRSGREKVLKRFAGRTKPVEFIGEQRTRQVSLSGRFAPESSNPGEVLRLADLPAPACVRAPDGQRYFVSLGDPSIDYQGVTAELSWSFTEIDHTEGGRL